MSDMAGKAAMGSGRAERERARYNGATGMSDPPPSQLRRGKHGRQNCEGRSEERGQRTSFKIGCRIDTVQFAPLARRKSQRELNIVEGHTTCRRSAISHGT